MSVIASSDPHNNNDDVIFDKRTFERLKNIDIEELEYENSDEEEDEQNEDANLRGDVKFNANDKYLH